VIAAFTFTAALATLPWFRDVVVRGERLASRNQRLDEQNDLLTTQNSRLATQNAERKQQNETLTAANLALKGTNEHLTTTNKTLTATNQTLTTSNSTLKAQNGTLQSANGALKGQNNALKGQNGRLASENAWLLKRRGELMARVTELREDVAAYQGTTPLFRGGDQITAQPFPPNAPANILAQGVRNLVYQVQDAARRKRGKTDRWQPEVKLVPPRGFPEREASRAAIEAWVVKQVLALHDKPVAIRMVAAQNCVEGRPFVVQPDWYPNQRVFRKGDEIARRQVDGAAEQGEVLEELIFFLQWDVSRQARAASMVPDESGVGRASYTLLLDALKRVREIHGPTTVVARARQDTFRAGPLYLELEVRAVDTAALGGG
jgi:uncharacterized protein (DUF3084 family)